MELAYILMEESPLVFNTKLLSFHTIFELLEFNTKFCPFHRLAWNKNHLYRLSSINSKMFLGKIFQDNNTFTEDLPEYRLINKM